MTIDYIEALGLLEHAGIRVVRAKYVDSAQDAVAFATRREARDPRVVPIVLSNVPREGAIPGHRAAPVQALQSGPAITAAYERLAAADESREQRILAWEYIAPGTDIALAYRVDDLGKAYLELRSGEHGTEQLLPIDETGARMLVEHMLAHDHRVRSEKSRRMLEHLVLRVCGLLDEFPINALELDPVRLHENSYTVLGALLTAPMHLRVGKRLANHAHDRKAHGYRPGGRQ
ncbi:MAG: hypothetical protein ABSB70_11735 [Candidatus Velthaea sp.]|jgi:hypothetical protein